MDISVVDRLEAARLEKEEAFIAERLEPIRADILETLDKDEGKKFLAREAQHQKKERQKQRGSYKGMTKEVVQTAKMKIRFLRYCSADTNGITRDKFKELLLDMCWKPVSETMDEAFQSFDTDASGEISFEEFRAWFETDQQKNRSGGMMRRMSSRMSRMRLSVAKKRGVASGNLDHKVAYKELVRKACESVRTNLQAEFRKTHPPITAASVRENGYGSNPAPPAPHESEALEQVRSFDTPSYAVKNGGTPPPRNSFGGQPSNAVTSASDKTLDDDPLSDSSCSDDSDFDENVQLAAPGRTSEQLASEFQKSVFGGSKGGQTTNSREIKPIKKKTAYDYSDSSGFACCW